MTGGSCHAGPSAGGRGAAPFLRPMGPGGLYTPSDLCILAESITHQSRAEADRPFSPNTVTMLHTRPEGREDPSEVPGLHGEPSTCPPEDVAPT